MAKDATQKSDTSEADLPDDAPKKGRMLPPAPAVVFYAVDRWHAATHARASWQVPNDVADRLRAALMAMTYAGPVRVTVDPALEPPEAIPLDAPPKAPTAPVSGDGFLIEPFDFVKV